MADGSLKVVMTALSPREGVMALQGEFAGTIRRMDAKAMIREWKELSETDKAQIRGGIEDGSMDYTLTPEQVAAARAK